jgi:broad specificity phosphatase PhoE
MDLLLIRHAESVGNAQGIIQGQAEYPLSDLGRQQAKALATRLQREESELDAVYSSDQSRAAETAQLLAAPLDMPVITDERLREYDFGEMNGVAWRDIESRFPTVWHALQEERAWLPIPGEEGHQAFHDRLAASLASIRARHTGQTVAIVSHGGSLGMILARLMGLPVQLQQPFRFDNASLSRVEVSRWGPILALLNDTSHLDGDLR